MSVNRMFHDIIVFSLGKGGKYIYIYVSKWRYARNAAVPKYIEQMAHTSVVLVKDVLRAQVICRKRSVVKYPIPCIQGGAPPFFCRKLLSTVGNGLIKISTNFLQNKLQSFVIC